MLILLIDRLQSSHNRLLPFIDKFCEKRLRMIDYCRLLPFIAVYCRLSFIFHKRLLKNVYRQIDKRMPQKAAHKRKQDLKKTINGNKRRKHFYPNVYEK